ncbi:MAG: DNA primase family protein, partial [Halobacteriota archaeon]
MTEHTDNPANHADSKYMDGLKREITKTLSTLFSDGDVIELRILSNGRVGSGYYTDRQALIDEVIRLEARKNANYQYYITLNELMPDVQHRRSGLKWGAEAHPTTTDADVIRRRWLLLDFDPERATGISATDEEKARAYAAMKLVRTWLAEHGFGAPIVADSGNGYHLLYLINIPADPATRDTENNRIIKQLLQAAADACNVEGVAIDLKVFNASRITKLYGTIARKGEHSKERPHRPSRLLAVPATLETVSVDLIKSVAHADSEGSLRKGTGAHSFNLGAWLDEHGIAVHKVKDEAEGTRYVLESCPFNHEHTDTAAYVIQFHNGAIAAKCHHDGCDGKNWSELRSKYEPDYAPDKPQERPANFEPIDAWYNDTRTYRNQESVATLFARLCKDELCFSHELNRWIYYNGKYWEEDRKAHVVNLLIAVINDLIAVIDNQRPLESDDRGVRRKDEFFKWATHLKNRHSLESILHIAKAKLAVSLDEFDADDTLFNANNGTVDLLTGTLRPHDPRDKITLLCPVNYRPEAQYERWDTFLMETLGRYDYVRYLQKEFGYCLTGLTKEELLIMLYGLPNTGKSTFYEPVMRVLGNYGHHMEFATLKRSDKGGGGAPREDLLRLRTSRIVMCSEINPKTIFDTEKVKQICSGEPIVARGIRARHSVEFPPKFKVVIGTNYQPIVPYDDGGSFRRIKVNPFVNVPSVIDKDLKQHFMEFPEAQERI